MNKYLMLFLVLCLVGATWLPTRKKLGSVILALTGCLVLFFLLFPNKL
jgi:hypothetical protein